MANKKSSKKRILISKIRNKRNMIKKSILKTYIKKVKKYIKENNKQLAIKEYKIFQSFLDKFSCKKIIHKNKSSRYKSKFIKLINKI